MEEGLLIGLFTIFFEFHGLNARRRSDRDVGQCGPHTTPCRTSHSRSVSSVLRMRDRLTPPTRLVGLDRLPARSADRMTGFYSTGLRLPPLELSLNQSRDNVRHCRGRLPTKDALGLGRIPGADMNVGSSKQVVPHTYVSPPIKIEMSERAGDESL